MTLSHMTKNIPLLDFFNRISGSTSLIIYPLLYQLINAKCHNDIFFYCKMAQICHDLMC